MVKEKKKTKQEELNIKRVCVEELFTEFWKI